MNYAVVVLVAILLFSTLYWMIRGKKHYTGPRLEVKVKVDESDPQDRNFNEEFNLKYANAYPSLA